MRFLRVSKSDEGRVAKNVQTRLIDIIFMIQWNIFECTKLVSKYFYLNGKTENNKSRLLCLQIEVNFVKKKFLFRGPETSSFFAVIFPAESTILHCPVCCIHFPFYSSPFIRSYLTNFYNRFLLFWSVQNVEERNDIFYETNWIHNFPRRWVSFCVFGLGDINLFSTKCLH